MSSVPSESVHLVVLGVYDHDIRASGLNLIPDFSRVEVNLPFVDIFGDSQTIFRYAQSLVISENILAIAGAQPYYTPPSPIVASFDPPCDAYRSDASSPGELLFDAYSILHPHDSPLFKTRFSPVKSQPYSIELYRNTSNQIITNGKLCDNFTTIFDSAVTTGEYAPVPIKAYVEIGKPALPESSKWEEVYGLKADFAFIEMNYLDCEQFRS
ncbi:hypothetical protein EJ05DRAFT_503810 [Pseudovirgaria hyperparasitica]|uniref:Uncharacterized protein n=1 Tax=Pseudovirgaria hyperparasitica TaxID=470096 RepID=A0A6A6VW07_9PEZI|nr:uncharacterized protein EJ05DRAFT_503810 [Pseudovirgaria hyperparasitica]KAF2754868.1 hypothetical protein EJ05DRAFT_503810 [Pseudovirgaria hyperparasitica]